MQNFDELGLLVAPEPLEFVAINRRRHWRS